MLQHKQLLAELRRALAHLDDPGYLETLPLVAHLSLVTQEADLSRGQALRRVLRLAIDALNPGANTAASTLDSRSYEVLYRYAIARQSMIGIAAALGIGERQGYRELQRATRALAQILSNLAAGIDYPVAATDDEASARAAQVRQELERLAQVADQDVDLSHLVTDALESIRPLAQDRGIAFGLRLGGPNLRVTANRVMLRQALLNLLSHVVSVHQGDRVAVDFFPSGTQARVTVTYHPQTSADSRDPKGPYAVAVQLFDSLGIGWQETPSAAGSTEISFSVAMARQRTVLIVDDNEDLIALFRRYLRHQPYRVYGATNLEQAQEMADATRPDAIILDVMMPQRDGWEVLQKLRTRDAGARARVIVCSIINDPQLATAMGADAFLNKPVSRGRLIQALESVLSSTA